MKRSVACLVLLTAVLHGIASTQSSDMEGCPDINGRWYVSLSGEYCASDFPCRNGEIFPFTNKFYSFVQSGSSLIANTETTLVHAIIVSLEGSIQDDLIISGTWEANINDPSSPCISPDDNLTANGGFEAKIANCEEIIITSIDGSWPRFSPELFNCDRLEDLVFSGTGNAVRVDIPAFSFSFDPADPLVGEEVVFTATDPNGVTTQWQWDFGDGTEPKTGPEVTHKFVEKKDFSVTLTALSNQITVAQVVPNGMMGETVMQQVTVRCSEDEAIDKVADELDCDGDALPNEWEVYGLYLDGKPMLDMPHDLDLPEMGADPLHKDIFVEIDYMEDRGVCVGDICVGGHTHKPLKQAILWVVDAFAKAPLKSVNNPDGIPGITLHVDHGSGSVMNPLTGELWRERSRSNPLNHQTVLGGTTERTDCSGMYNGFDQHGEFTRLKEKNFISERRSVFHYAVFAHQLGGLERVSGISAPPPASDFIVALGHREGQVGTESDQAGTFMHELGHNLGLMLGCLKTLSRGHF